MPPQLNALDRFVPIFNIETARLLWMNGQSDAALEIITQLPIQPGGNLAKIYASLGRYSEAADILESEPGDGPAAARILRMAGKKAMSTQTLPRVGLPESYVY